MRKHNRNFKFLNENFLKKLRRKEMTIHGIYQLMIDGGDASSKLKNVNFQKFLFNCTRKCKGFLLQEEIFLNQ